MSDPEPVYLFGEKATGKSTLSRLFDGHPELAVSPLHDYLVDAFARAGPDRDVWIEENGDRFLNNNKFRRILSSSGYYKWQDAAIRGWYDYPSVAGEYMRFQLESLDFCEFESTWLERINDGPVPEFQDILRIIYDSFFDCWGNYDYDRETCEYFVSWSYVFETSPIEYLLEAYDGSKAIFIERDPRGVVAAKAADRSDDLREILTEGKIFDMLEFYADVRELQQEYPDRLRIIAFEDLILNPSDIIEELRAFLDVSPDPVLDEVTFCGEEIEMDTPHFGKINDDYEEILSQSEKRIVDLHIGESTILSARPGESYVYARSYANWRKRRAWDRLKSVGISIDEHV
jgi:hypothetical protein